MRSVNVAELKNSLSKYLRFAKAGEEVVIRDRSRPIARLVPVPSKGVDEHELRLVAEGTMHLPHEELDLKQLSKIPTGRVRGKRATQALLRDREESF